ncbi:radical SAM protein [uncultured Clostridium sp.]|uniref:radical SAM protein n=1 Tax=uncultured Clostridium sp. TaxID=59620 RepID=UPI0025F190AC|nr:radical SAM protein [uncultured Clostridium sp.]
MFVSLIIYANRDNNQFINCIESLKYQDYKNFEVIIIDGNYNLKRELYIKNECSDLDIKYIKKLKDKRMNMEIAHCRNIGIKESKGEVLIFSEDSMIFLKDFISKHVVYNEENPKLCVNGEIEYLADRRVDIRKYKENFAMNLIVTKNKKVLSKYNYKVIDDEKWNNDIFTWENNKVLNLSVSSEVVKSIGGFDEDISIYATSDSDFLYKLKKAGIKFVHAKEIITYQQFGIEYPTVRWRASGSEYIPFKYQTDELFEWLNVKQVERDIVDYNRYNDSKVIVSEDYQLSLINKFSNGNLKDEGCKYSYIVLIDVTDDINEKIVEAVRYIEDICISKSNTEIIFFNKTLDFDSKINAKIESIKTDIYLKYYYCNKKKLLNCVLNANKYMNVLKLTSKNEKIKNLITKYEEKILTKLENLKKDILLKVLEDCNGIYMQMVRLSKLKNKLDEKENIIDDNWLYKNEFKDDIRNYGIDYEENYEKVEDGFSLPPRAISFRLTHKCNLHCKMCGQWGENGNFKDKDKSFVNAFLDFSMLKKIVDDAAKFRPGMFYIWGGEPLLHPNYIDLIRYIKEKKIFCTTTTNGTLLKKYAKEICDIGTEFIRVSIDGKSEIHNKIRGRENCFEDSIEGIRMINEIKKNNNLTYPIIECDSVILPENYEHIEEYLDYMNTLEGINSVNFSHPIYSTEDIGKRQALEFKKQFNIDAVSWKGFLMDLSSIDTDKLIKIIRKVQNNTYNFQINFDPPMKKLQDIALHYKDIETLYKERFCTVPWIWVEIHPNGLVSFCEDFCDYYIGDLTQKSFSEIWNGEKARIYRKKLIKKDKFPICSHCGLLCHDADY